MQFGKKYLFLYLFSSFFYLHSDIPIIRDLFIRRINNSKKTGILDLSKLQIKNLSSIGTLLGKDARKIKELYLNGNKIDSVKRNDLNNFRNLRVLDLSFNHIKHLDKSSFFALKKLQRLDLSNNLIKLLPQKIFLKQSRLIYLDLSDNKIEDLKKGLFRELKNIEKINLADNKLQNISPQLFKKNKKLKELYLRGNKLKILTSGFGGRDFGKMIKDLKVKEEIFDLW